MDRSLATTKEQSAPDRVLTNYIHWAAVAEAIHDLLPRFATVMGTINVLTLIVEPYPINRCVSRVRVESPGVHDRDLAPRRQSRRSCVAPVFAAVASHVNQSVVGSRPDHVHVFV